MRKPMAAPELLQSLLQRRRAVRARGRGRSRLWREAAASLRRGDLATRSATSFARVARRRAARRPWRSSATSTRSASPSRTSRRTGCSRSPRSAASRRRRCSASASSCSTRNGRVPAVIGAAGLKPGAAPRPRAPRARRPAPRHRCASREEAERARAPRRRRRVARAPPVELPNGRLLSRRSTTGSARTSRSRRRGASRRRAARGRRRRGRGRAGGDRLYGARVAAFGLDPQVALVIDVTPATDVPGRRPRRAGADRARRRRDDRARPDAEPARRRGLLAEVAEREGIAHAFEVYTRGHAHGCRRAALRPRRRPDRADLDPDAVRAQPERALLARRRRGRPCSSSSRSRSLSGASSRSCASVARVTRSVIVSAVRTPFGRLGGGLAGYEATQLGAIAIAAALERIGLEPHEPQYAIMGQVLQAGAGQAPARQAAIARGPADRDACRHDQQGVRVVDPGDRDRRLDDPRRGRRASSSPAAWSR